MSASCEKTWIRHYSGIAPVGFVLRRTFRDRWIRFHYFDDDRRTPMSAGERSLVVERLNSIASAVWGSSERCVLLLVSFGVRMPPPWAAVLGVHQVRGEAVRKWKGQAEYLGEDLPRFWCGQIDWHRGVLDKSFESVAIGNQGPVAVASVETGDCICPYEGGVDVFSKNPNLRTELARRFAALHWKER